MDSVFRLEMLGASHGDAILVEYGKGEHLNRILVDGGPIHSYAALHARLLRLPSPRKIDLLVITHVDTDHIEGIIRLLADDTLAIEWGEIWFNGWPQLSPGDKISFPAWKPTDAGPFRAPTQGAVASARLQPWMKQWNHSCGGRALCVPDNGSLPTVTLPGDMRITLLSPSVHHLKKLASEWRKELLKKKISPDDFDTIEKRLGTRYRAADGGATPDGNWHDFDVVPDDAIANGSSIAFLAEHAGRTCALLADAFTDQVEDAFDRLPREAGRPVRLDALKTSHHGSERNISERFMRRVKCENFLFSTDGSRHGHPDDSTLELVTRRVPGAHLVFNYASDRTRPWIERAPCGGFRASAPLEGNGGIAFDLMSHAVVPIPQ